MSKCALVWNWQDIVFPLKERGSQTCSHRNVSMFKRSQEQNSNCNHCTGWLGKLVFNCFHNNVSSLCAIIKHLSFFELSLSRFLNVFFANSSAKLQTLCSTPSVHVCCCFSFFVRDSFGVNSILNRFVGHSSTEEVNPYEIVKRLEKQTVKKLEICKNVLHTTNYIQINNSTDTPKKHIIKQLCLSFFENLSIKIWSGLVQNSSLLISLKRILWCQFIW